MSILTQKKCSKCGETKTGSHKSWCKKCFNAYSAEWLKKHPRNYRTEKERERSRKRRQANPERASLFVRLWQKAHPDKVREKSLRWAHLHPEKHREAFRKWSTPEKEAERRKRRYDANPEAELAKCRVRNQKRRARLIGNGGTITKEEWQWLKEFYNFTCLCCGRREPEIKLTLDHVLPLTMGGKNVIENAQPLCKSCNSSKHNKHIDYRPKRMLM